MSKTWLERMSWSMHSMLTMGLQTDNFSCKFRRLLKGHECAGRHRRDVKLHHHLHFLSHLTHLTHVSTIVTNLLHGSWIISLFFNKVLKLLRVARDVHQEVPETFSVQVPLCHTLAAVNPLMGRRTGGPSGACHPWCNLSKTLEMSQSSWASKLFQNTCLDF